MGKQKLLYFHLVFIRLEYFCLNSKLNAKYKGNLIKILRVKMSCMLYWSILSSRQFLKYYYALCKVLYFFINSINTLSIVYIIFIGGLNVAFHCSSYQIFYFQCDLAGMLITVGWHVFCGNVFTFAWLPWRLVGGVFFLSHFSLLKCQSLPLGWYFDFPGTLVFTIGG